MAEGRGLLNKGDLVRSSEKLWAGAALTIKMTAAKKMAYIKTSMRMK
ncbi:MAG: PaREP1 family protein [bacterium]